jgi:1-acyl-sn-glycerol-3-phosphate acyltransferase
MSPTSASNSSSNNSGGSFALAMLGIAETFRVCAPTLVEAAMGTLTRQTCDDRLDAWSRRLRREAAIDLHVHGRDDIPRDETFVVMSNHQSLFDIPMLFQALRPMTLRMVAKTELYKIPVFGRTLTIAEFVELDRSDKGRARESLALAQRRLKSGINVWIAPEGTRSPTGRLAPFKGGGFKLALDTGARILPVTIEGTRHVMAAKAATVRRGERVDVTIHAPIDPQPFGRERRDQLVALVRKSITSALPEDLRDPA